MKYLLLNGSPHKGNTWKLVEIVKENLIKSDEEAVFEEIHLAKLNLPFCCGCSLCFRQGHEKCPHSDKVMQVIESIDNADGVIVASTAYNMRETAMLKNLFDHLCFMLHRPYFFKSKAIVLTTTGGVGGKAAAKSISSMLTGIGFNKCYMLSVKSLSWNDYKPTDRTKTKLQKTANKFYRDVASKRLHSPAFANLIPYNLFRGMSLAYVKGTEYETQDGVHWTAECRAKSVYDSSVKVPFHKKLFGQMFYGIGKLTGKMVTTTYKK